MVKVKSDKKNVKSKISRKVKPKVFVKGAKLNVVLFGYLFLKSLKTKNPQLRGFFKCFTNVLSFLFVKEVASQIADGCSP